MLPGTAQAAVIHGEFSNIVTNLGILTDRVLLEPPDPPATIDGEFNPEDNTFVVAAENWRQPPSRVFEGANGIFAQLEFATNAPVTGTFDPATGAMTAVVDTRITTHLSGAVDVSCTVPSFVQTYTTEASYGTAPAVRTGSPFAPPSGQGGLVTTWTTLPAASEGDPTCTALVGAVAGSAPGGNLLSGFVAVAETAGELPPPPPPPAPIVGPTTPTPEAPTGGGGGGPRLNVASISADVAARAQRRPYRYTISGTLELPEGIRAADGCAGVVGVQIKTKGQTISERRTRVQSDCTYRSTVAFGNRRRFAGGRRLSAIVRFNGNQVLLPERLPTIALRVG